MVGRCWCCGETKQGEGGLGDGFSCNVWRVQDEADAVAGERGNRVEGLLTEENGGFLDDVAMTLDVLPHVEH